MPEGVQFTKSSANRIGDTVRSVEGRPFPENKLQRRRSGAGSRSTLWQVTAVQTGPETCTIERVENQEGDLIEASEKLDVLYDTDKVPSVGDRGLLIRLGEGSLFFFSPTRSIRSHANEGAIVKETSPNTTFDYNADTHTIFRDSTSVDNRLVYKFPRPVWAEASYNFADVCIGEGVTPIPGGGTLRTWILENLGSSQIFWGGGIKLDFIGEDFDCSTITWNILQSLSTIGQQLYCNMDNIRTNDGSYSAVHMGQTSPPNLFMLPGGTIGASTRIYGMTIYFNNPPTDCEYTCVLNGFISQPPGGLSNSNRVWIDIGATHH